MIEGIVKSENEVIIANACEWLRNEIEAYSDYCISFSTHANGKICKMTKSKTEKFIIGEK